MHDISALSAAHLLDRSMKSFYTKIEMGYFLREIGSKYMSGVFAR
jgi:hypothetical protein